MTKKKIAEATMMIRREALRGLDDLRRLLRILVRDLSNSACDRFQCFCRVFNLHPQKFDGGCNNSRAALLRKNRIKILKLVQELRAACLKPCTRPKVPEPDKLDLTSAYAYLWNYEKCSQLAATHGAIDAMARAASSALFRDSPAARHLLRLLTRAW